MRSRGVAIVAITLMMLAPASSAIATIVCGMPVQTGPGVVEMTVTSNLPFVFDMGTTVGNVTFDQGTCTSTPVTSCM